MSELQDRVLDFQERVKGVVNEISEAIRFRYNEPGQVGALGLVQLRDFEALIKTIAEGEFGAVMDAAYPVQIPDVDAVAREIQECAGYQANGFRGCFQPNPLGLPNIQEHRAEFVAYAQKVLAGAATLKAWFEMPQYARFLLDAIRQ